MRKPWRRNSEKLIIWRGQPAQRKQGKQAICGGDGKKGVRETRGEEDFQEHCVKMSQRA